ncbi:substrate-binding domain-containing protein [Alteriqipengyuania sp. WL0013]|uniref:substrate-binding domain-containing protein n=1 Tax=Alteriqipengyuania sp. WL0013 TaxID=3110773 RepID=UPI002CB1615C|nr:substrate-binding domain-containing protein [Alteriqipengyuania sp. WL0013]MEB3415069.1 substrate-binding domain-containing protein [Alteriqipengyuania sp. WL0013]
MKFVLRTSLLAVAAVSLAACGSSSDSRDNVRAVGSSTVLPFAKKVAEEYGRANPEMNAPIIESNGTGGGIELFCAGVGTQHPDIANASRRMKASEFETCQKNGVTEITEIEVGLDGIAFAAAKDGIDIALTPEQVYMALAANPYGEEQTATKWSDIDPSLPDIDILVYGPPETSGTSDALKELILTPGCASNADMAAMKESDEERYEEICTSLRTDGAYSKQGEQDNLIVKKLAQTPNAIGVFGYSYLEENLGSLKGIAMNGVEPTYENIADFSYPGARPLFIYVKKQHIGAIPGLEGFLAQWGQMWGKDGPLTSIGLIANPDDKAADMMSRLTALPTLDGAELK